MAKSSIPLHGSRRSRKAPRPDAYRHESADRLNVPTSETERYMAERDREPVPYRPELRESQGPRLSWRREGPDELEREAGPLYVHEKIEPGALLRQLEGSRDDEGFVRSLFNGLPEAAHFEWYRHRGNWSNRLIHGDSAQIMASLARKEGIEGQVQMVYFDPPYGIGYKATMQVNTRSRGGGESAKDMSPEPEAVSVFRDAYKRGIHDYLDVIRERVALAQTLLAQTGSLFVQIGPQNVHRLALVLDEVFGSENRVAMISFAKSGSTSSTHLSEVADYLLWYAKDKEQTQYHQIYESLDRREKIEHMSSYAMVELADGSTRKLTKDEREDPNGCLPDGARCFRRMPLDSQGASTTGRSEPFHWQGRTWPCPVGRHWTVDMVGMQRLADLGRLDASGKEGRLSWKRYEDEVAGRRIHNLWSSQMSASDLHYKVETAESVVERCLLMTTEPGDLVLDITCGSGTTPLAAERWGRRWIATDASRIPIALARQRLLAGVHDWYVLSDSPEGRKLEAEYKEEPPQPGHATAADPAAGFVYERVRHVSAAKLAYDEAAQNTLLVDRPHKARGIRRISSPFTVESRSPYRSVSPEDYIADDYTAAAHENLTEALLRAGLRTRGGGRLLVREVEPCSDEQRLVTHLAWAEESLEHVRSEEDSTERSGRSVRCAISLLPDDATASQAWIDQAAHEAAAMREVEELFVVAFNFESDALLDTRSRRGRLGIRCFRANRDLMIETLANERHDQAFVQIGEPEIQIEQADEGRITVAILGFDTFDPATGNLTTGGVSDVDCWMIDTDYDQAAFFARRIHFPDKGSDRQLLRYRRVLKNLIADDEWEAMLSTKSTPFDRPTTGRIAVRIITTTGVEMTAVREVEP